MAAIESISRTLSCFNLVLLESKCLQRDSLRLNADAPVRISKPYCRRCFEGESLLSTNVSGNKRKRRNKRMNKYPAMNRRVSSALLDRKPNAQGSKPFATRARVTDAANGAIRSGNGTDFPSKQLSPLPLFQPLFPSFFAFLCRPIAAVLCRVAFPVPPHVLLRGQRRRLSRSLSPPTSLKRRNESVC